MPVTPDLPSLLAEPNSIQFHGSAPDAGKSIYANLVFTSDTTQKVRVAIPVTVATAGGIQPKMFPNAKTPTYSFGFRCIRAADEAALRYLDTLYTQHVGHEPTTKSLLSANGLGFARLRTVRDDEKRFEAQSKTIKNFGPTTHKKVAEGSVLMLGVDFGCHYQEIEEMENEPAHVTGGVFMTVRQVELEKAPEVVMLDLPSLDELVSGQESNRGSSPTSQAIPSTENASSPSPTASPSMKRAAPSVTTTPSTLKRRFGLTPA